MEGTLKIRTRHYFLCHSGFTFQLENSPSSNELIGYEDLPDFNEIWPKWSSDINPSKRVGLLRNSKIFFP